MGAVIVCIVLLIVVLGVAGMINDRVNTREWRPFIGVFLIAAMIVVLGFIVGFVFPGVAQIFFSVAKWVAVVGACLLCIKIIANIGQSFFSNKDP
jgi:hypothetical protein